MDPVDDLRFTIDTLCNALDSIARHEPSAVVRREIERIASEARARALVVGDRHRREKMNGVVSS